jgi:hypothetical protein
MKKAFYLHCCLFFFLSCSKESKQSKSSLLAAGTWKIIADSISPGRVLTGPAVETDMFVYYGTCELDNYFEFKSNGTYELNNGPKKCNPADLQKLEGTWFLSDGDTKLSLSPDPVYLSDKCDILELTTARLRLAWYTREPNGAITRAHYITLIH